MWLLNGLLERHVFKQVHLWVTVDLQGGQTEYSKIISIAGAKLWLIWPMIWVLSGALWRLYICQLPLKEIFSRSNPQSYCHSRPPRFIGISIWPVAFAGNELKWSNETHEYPLWAGSPMKLLVYQQYLFTRSSIWPNGRCSIIVYTEYTVYYILYIYCIRKFESNLPFANTPWLYPNRKIIISRSYCQ